MLVRFRLIDVYKDAPRPQLILVFILLSNNQNFQTLKHFLTAFITLSLPRYPYYPPSKPNQPPKMPGGFPAFRHDPTTAPQYIIRSSNSTSNSQPRYRDSPSQPTESAKLSKYQYPTERGIQYCSIETY